MSTMQEFYDWLSQAPETDSPDWAPLAQLTQATVAEMSALKRMADWCEWHPA